MISAKKQNTFFKTGTLDLQKDSSYFAHEMRT